jgi:hypothetical protein
LFLVYFRSLINLGNYKSIHTTLLLVWASGNIYVQALYACPAGKRHINDNEETTMEMLDAAASTENCCEDAVYSCAVINDAQDIFQCPEGKTLIENPELQVGADVDVDICCIAPLCALVSLTCTEWIAGQTYSIGRP